jgi:hypothetical protein
MVEPIFSLGDLEVAVGKPEIYELRSTGSGQAVRVHFCANCGTKLFLTFDRFPTACGIYAGTYDDPHWFDIEPATAKHIFVSAARPDSIVPAGLAVFAEHAMSNDGKLHQPVILDAPASPENCLILLRR